MTQIQRLTSGAVGGLAGGLAFGLLMGHLVYGVILAATYHRVATGCECSK